MKDELSHSLIRDIFAGAGLGGIRSIRKITIGFSHDVYSIDDRYILKVCGSEEDEDHFRRDVYLCNLLGDRVPAPRIILLDTSKTLADRFFMIYHRIPGHNLYSRWHLLDRSARRDLTREICDILRLINHTPYAGFAEEFQIDTGQSWRDMMCSRIGEWIEKLGARELLSADLLPKTRLFLEKNSEVLREERMALTYHDPHFDNIIVSDDNRIAGVLDFERTDIVSIDYVLDLVRRMVTRPGKYASEESEPFARAEDYSELLHWYEEFYPEPFDFADMEKRLDIYTVEHSLAEIFYYPEGHAARQELRRLVG